MNTDIDCPCFSQCSLLYVTVVAAVASPCKAMQFDNDQLKVCWSPACLESITIVE